jgi:hypothetical protein
MKSRAKYGNKKNKRALKGRERERERERESIINAN